MKTERMMRCAVAVLAAAGLGLSATNALGDAYIQTIDPFTSGPGTVTASAGHTPDGLIFTDLPDVMGTRRELIASVPLPALQTNPTVHATVNTSAAVLEYGSDPAAVGEAELIYAGPDGKGLHALFETNGGTHLAFDFLSNSFPMLITIFATLDAGTPDEVLYEAQKSIPASNVPFRVLFGFQEADQDFTKVLGPDNVDGQFVDVVDIHLSTGVGESWVLDGIGIVPAPGAVMTLAPLGLMLVRRRR